LTPVTGAELASDLQLVGIKLLVFGIVVAVAYGIGRVTGIVLGRVASRLGGDALMRQTVVGRALQKSGYNAYSFTHALTLWVIFIAGILSALETLSIAYVTTSVTAFLDYLPILVSALLILVVGVIVSDWVGELIKKSTSTEVREVFYLSLIGDGTKAILYFVTITIVLSRLGVNVSILDIIAQAFAWAVAIAVGVAAGLVVGWVMKDKVKGWLQSNWS